MSSTLVASKWKMSCVCKTTEMYISIGMKPAGRADKPWIGTSTRRGRARCGAVRCGAGIL